MAGTSGGDTSFSHLSSLLDFTLPWKGGSEDSLRCWGQVLRD